MILVRITFGLFTKDRYRKASVMGLRGLSTGTQGQATLAITAGAKRVAREYFETGAVRS